MYEVKSELTMTTSDIEVPVPEAITAGIQMSKQLAGPT